MRKRASIAVAGVLCGAVGLYGLYYLSPIGRHNRQASAYERKVRAEVSALDGVHVVSASHHVTGNQWGTSGDCSLLADVEVTTGLDAPVLKEQLTTALTAHRFDYLYLGVTSTGGKAGRHTLRVEVGTLVSGGIDPRCG